MILVGWNEIINTDINPNVCEKLVKIPSFVKRHAIFKEDSNAGFFVTSQSKLLKQSFAVGCLYGLYVCFSKPKECVRVCVCVCPLNYRSQWTQGPQGVEQLPTASQGKDVAS